MLAYGAVERGGYMGARSGWSLIILPRDGGTAFSGELYHGRWGLTSRTLRVTRTLADVLGISTHYTSRDSRTNRTRINPSAHHKAHPSHNTANHEFMHGASTYFEAFVYVLFSMHALL